MQAARMNLKILLPFKIFAEKTGVSRIVAESHAGSFGALLSMRVFWSNPAPTYWSQYAMRLGEPIWDNCVRRSSRNF